MKDGGGFLKSNNVNAPIRMMALRLSTLIGTALIFETALFALFPDSFLSGETNAFLLPKRKTNVLISSVFNMVRPLAGRLFWFPGAFLYICHFKCSVGLHKTQQSLHQLSSFDPEGEKRNKVS